MPDPKAPVAAPAEALVAPAGNSPAVAPTSLVIDERFAALAGDFMSQVDAKLDAVRQEFATQFGLNVDPLHKDVHDLLDQNQAGDRIAKLEAANFVTPEDLQKQVEGLGEAVAEKLAPKIQPVVQPAINVTDKAIEDRLTKIEKKFRFF
jgi:hypothetical protein